MTADQPPEWSTAPVMLRKHLIADGWNDRAIARMVRAGMWARIRHGAYVDRSVWVRCDAAARHAMTARAVVMQSRTRLALSHSSALPFYDGSLWGFDTRWVHGTRADGKCGRKAAGVQQHCGSLIDGDVVERYGVEVMAAHRVGLEVTTAAPVEVSLMAVNHLLERGFTSLDQLRARYRQGIEFWKGTLATDLVLRLATPLCESAGESRFLYRCYAAGLPAPVQQYEVRDPSDGFLARLDFAWPALGVFVEFDGLIKYSAYLRAGETSLDAVVREKRREDRIVELTGWQCVRVVWADLEHPEALVRRLRSLLGATSMSA